MLARFGQQLIYRIHERRQPERAQDAAERSGELDSRKEHDTSSPIARDGSAVAEYEPPTFSAFVLWDPSEQSVGLLIGEWKQCQFLASVKRSDDTRRPTAEPSAARVKQNRPRELEAGICGICHCRQV